MTSHFRKESDQKLDVFSEHNSSLPHTYTRVHTMETHMHTPAYKWLPAIIIAANSRRGEARINDERRKSFSFELYGMNFRISAHSAHCAWQLLRVALNYKYKKSNVLATVQEIGQKEERVCAAQPLISVDKVTAVE